MSKHILVVDCGSTGIRSIIVNSNGKIINRTYKKIAIMHPEPGATENDPEHLWDVFKHVVQKGLSIPFIKIEAIAITNQRSTFALWDKKSGKPLTNFINWQDVRSAETARKMNKKTIWQLLRGFAFIVGRIINNPLLIVTSMLTLTTDHTICKLRWILDKTKKFSRKDVVDNLQFGTIDTWLLYKLTGKKAHLTDYTNASSTTLLNPFMMKWNTLFCSIFKIPTNILPKVLDTNGDFGFTDPHIFGKKIPVTTLVGDQQASLFGHHCFDPGDVKISLGSGAFVSMNVGPKPKYSKKGLFPLIAWTFNGTPTYTLEGQVATVGTYIDWAIEDMGFFSSPKELDALASECKDSNGVFCLPTLTGIKFPYFKADLTASISGLTLRSNKSHLALSIIQGIAHRVCDVIDGMENDTKIKIPRLKMDGGVSNSDILLQTIADFSGKSVLRSSEHDLTSLGAAYFSGISIGIWRDLKEISKLRIPSIEFTPKISNIERITSRKNWKKKILQIEKEYSI